MTAICKAKVGLKKYQGSFENAEGVVVNYTKYYLVIGNDVEIEVTFDKSVKNLVTAYVPFELVEGEE